MAVTMTKTAARERARRESSMYRQGSGSGWIVSTWDGAARAKRLSGELSFWTARIHLRDWRQTRAAELYGWRNDE